MTGGIMRKSGSASPRGQRRESSRV